MDNKSKIISYNKKPKKIHLKEQAQILKENRIKRKTVLNKLNKRS
ncbi:hypothetical protein PBN151_0628 [Paenibacillus sp. NAIST15-1]|nr:hypothetical protein PBN151_0628 [Paenibacillus sp. NAIST15-1]